MATFAATPPALEAALLHRRGLRLQGEARGGVGNPLVLTVSVPRSVSSVRKLCTGRSLRSVYGLPYEGRR